MEKTISFLNSKIWYRTLKVCFIFIFLILFVGFNLFVFGEMGFKNIDQNKTKIICNEQDKKYFSPKDINIYLHDYD